MKEYSRAERVADAIQRELALIIDRELKDPRVHFVTVSAVKVSKDLSFATVYISTLDTDSEKIAEILKVLDKAKGFMRKQLGSRLSLRLVPELKFKFDSSLQYGNQMSGLINQALAEDAEHLSVDDDESDNNN